MFSVKPDMNQAAENTELKIKFNAVTLTCKCTTCAKVCKEIYRESSTPCPFIFIPSPPLAVRSHFCGVHSHYGNAHFSNITQNEKNI